CAKKEDSLDFW
nr:immunoglobulin heavy chain junction region [Macaca mulatta]